MTAHVLDKLFEPATARSVTVGTNDDGVAVLTGVVNVLSVMPEPELGGISEVVDVTLVETVWPSNAMSSAFTARPKWSLLVRFTIQS